MSNLVMFEMDKIMLGFYGFIGLTQIVMLLNWKKFKKMIEKNFNSNSEKLDKFVMRFNIIIFWSFMLMVEYLTDGFVWRVIENVLFR